jgi:hypothetical protein
MEEEEVDEVDEVDGMRPYQTYLELDELLVVAVTPKNHLFHVHWEVVEEVAVDPSQLISERISG